MTFFPMLILGATNLIPWMTFLSLPDYFHELYGSNKMEFFFRQFQQVLLSALQQSWLQ